MNKYSYAKVVFAVILCIVILLFSSGCDNNDSDAVKLQDNLEQIRGLEDHSPSNELSMAFSDQVFYEIKNISWENDIGTAEVIVTAPDLSKIIASSIEKALDECGAEDYDTLLKRAKQLITEALNSNDYPIVEKTVEMETTKNAGDVELISNEKFEKAISGNLEELFIHILTEGSTDGD